MRRAGLSRWSGFWPHFECRSMMRMQQNSRWTWYDTVDFERHSMIRRQRLCRVRKCLQRAWWEGLESSSSISPPPLIARSWSKHCFHKKHFSSKKHIRAMKQMPCSNFLNGHNWSKHCSQGKKQARIYTCLHLLQYFDQRIIAHDLCNKHGYFLICPALTIERRKQFWRGES